MTIPVGEHHAEYLKDNIEYHSFLGVSNFLVMLHNFPDGLKRNVKRELSDYPVTFIGNTNPIFEDGEVRTRLAKKAYELFSSDWIINNDVDEYWVPKSGESLNEIFYKYTDANVVTVQRYNMLAYTTSIDTYVSPPRSYIYRIIRPLTLSNSRFDEVSPLEFMLKKKSGKSASRGKGIISVGPGSHLIQIKDKVNILSEDIVIYHYPYSTKEHFIKELRNKIGSMLADKSLTQRQNWHIRYLEYYYNSGRIEDVLSVLFPDADLVEELEEKGVVEKSTFVHDFFMSSQEIGSINNI